MENAFAGRPGDTTGKKSMRAAVCRNYGGPEVVTIEHSPIPLPAPDEVQVRVKYTSVTSGDARVRSFRDAGFMWPVMRLALGVLRPRNPVLGMEYAGVVTKAGSKVSRFIEGDHVFGIGFGGAHAEFMTIKEASAVSKLPETWSMQDAVALPFGAIAALVFLRDYAAVSRGERILVVGASGNVGCMAIQIAKAMGLEVHGICSSANTDLVRKLGAQKVFDYNERSVSEIGSTYDVVLDTVGTTRHHDVRKNLNSGGRHVYLKCDLPQIFLALATRFSSKRVKTGISPDKREDLEFSEIADAHAYVDRGHKVGSVVVCIDYAIMLPRRFDQPITGQFA